MDLAQLYSANRYHDVIEYFQKQENFLPSESPLDSHILAACYFKSGDYSKAYEILSCIESALYDDANFLSLFGAACRRLMFFDKAKECFLRAIELSPDSVHLKNNYSNLLIDLGNHQEALSILEPIALSHPDYADALENLNRVRYLIECQSSQGSDNSSLSSVESFVFQDPLSDIWDPMLLAFSDDEVNEYGRIKDKIKVAESKTSSKLDLPSVPPDGIAAEYLKLAAKAVADKDFNLALQLCTKSYSLTSPSSTTYLTCSDAYLALKQFYEAEICILTSLVLSEPTSVQFLNLSSLASMRSDFKLAFHYLDRSAALDPSNPMIDKVRRNLDKLKSVKSEYSFCTPWSPSVN